jgi:hypothetical protein
VIGVLDREHGEADVVGEHRGVHELEGEARREGCLRARALISGRVRAERLAPELRLAGAFGRSLVFTGVVVELRAGRRGAGRADIHVHARVIRVPVAQAHLADRERGALSERGDGVPLPVERIRGTMRHHHGRDRLVRRRPVAEHEDVAREEEVEDALVFEEAMDEVEIRLPPLHAIRPPRVALGQPELGDHADLRERVGHDLGDGHVPEYP